MLFKQSKNSFIRSTEKYGYVTNQLTQFDRVYNSTGADFLREVSREPRSIEDAVEHLLTIFEGVSKEELTQDFQDFILDLSKHRFVIIGETIEELEAKDLDFFNSVAYLDSFIVSDKLRKEMKKKGLDKGMQFWEWKSC